MQLLSLGQEDPLEEEMAARSSVLAWRIPRTGSWRATVHRIAESAVTEHMRVCNIRVCLLHHLYLSTDSKGNRLYLLNLHIPMSCYYYSHLMVDETRAKITKSVSSL